MALMLLYPFVKKKAPLFLDHLTVLARKICHLLIQGVMADVIYYTELLKKVTVNTFFIHQTILLKFQGHHQLFNRQPDRSIRIASRWYLQEHRRQERNRTDRNPFSCLFGK